MSRTNNVSKLNWLQGTLGTSNPTTEPVSLLGVARASITVRQTPGSPNALVGQVTVQVTDFGGAPGGNAEYGLPPLETDYTDLSTLNITGGTTNRVTGLDTISGKFIRLKWVDGGSVGATIDAAITLTHFTRD